MNTPIPITPNTLLFNFFDKCTNKYANIKEKTLVNKKYKITSFSEYPNSYKITGINTSIRFLENVDKKTYISNFFLFSVTL